jgi:hypothetical protein
MLGQKILSQNIYIYIYTKLILVFKIQFVALKMIQKFKMLPFKMLHVGLFKAFFAIFDVLEASSHEPSFNYILYFIFFINPF